MARAIKTKKCSPLRYYQALIMVGIVVFLFFQFKLLIALSDENIDKSSDKPESSIPSAPVVTKCTCVDCNEDKICGGLWRGNRYPGMPSDKEVIHVKIHIVVSHCKKSLDWMPKYLEGFTNITSIHVISKCGQVVKGSPNEAVTVVLPNVGRCDHAYAHYITNILPQLVTTKNATHDNSIVVFLKDTTMIDIHQSTISKFRRTSLKSLARIASSVNGFACGLDIVQGSEMSAYHDVKTLREQQLGGYNKGEQDYKNGDGVPFQSKFKTLGDFQEALNFPPPHSLSLVQQCYGGIFAVRTKNIFQQDMNLWRILRKTLERGDNIQEGHFAERSWGPLLATPLQAFQTKALVQHSTGVRIDHWAIHGALIKAAAEKNVSKIEPRRRPGRSTLFVDIVIVHSQGWRMSQQMRRVGNSLDRIGWRNVLEGKVSEEFLQMQKEHLLKTQSFLTIDSWTRGFLDKLLSLTHTQWICRNLTKHHRTQGTKAFASREEILKEIEHQLNLGSDGLSSDARCLLEIPTDELYGNGKPTSELQYWLNAAVASRQAAGDRDKSGGLLEPPSGQVTTGAKQRAEGKSMASGTSKAAASARKPKAIAPIFRPKKAKRPARPSVPPTRPPTTLPPAVGPQQQERIGLLQRNSDEELQRCHVGALLRDVPANFQLCLKGGDKVRRDAMRSLRPPQSLTDEVINDYKYLLRVLLLSISSESFSQR